MDKDEYIRARDDVLAALEDKKENSKNGRAMETTRSGVNTKQESLQLAIKKRSHKTLIGSAAESTAVLVSGLAHSGCSWIGCFLVFLTTA
jgi:hypothetical protein